MAKYRRHFDRAKWPKVLGADARGAVALKPLRSAPVNKGANLHRLAKLLKPDSNAKISASRYADYIIIRGREPSSSMPENNDGNMVVSVGIGVSGEAVCGEASFRMLQLKFKNIKRAASCLSSK